MSCFALLILTTGIAVPANAQPRDPYADVRNQMVDVFVAGEGIKNRRVLQAIRTVPRHEFVKPGNRLQAYHDTALPIGNKQTISPPFVVAYMTAAIDPQPTDKVLEIGTGSGYQAAVLAELAKEVYSIEIVEPLGKTAARRLKRLGYDNVNVKIGDGYKGWAEHGPFDKMIVTCSPEKVPLPLIQQLREGGKMIVPLGQRYQQVFYLLEKKDGKLIQKKLIPTLFVPMTGISEDKREVQPNPDRPELINGGFEIDANDDGLADHWHYQRQTELMESDAKEGSRYIHFTNNDPGRMCQALQGMAFDGRRLEAIRLRFWAKYEKAARGNKLTDQPAVVVHFYDSVRRPIGDTVVKSFTGTLDWQAYSGTIPVPPQTKEAIIRIGLNGGVGELSIDGLVMQLRKR